MNTNSPPLYINTSTGSVDTQDGWSWFDEETASWRDPVAECDPFLVVVDSAGEFQEE